MFYESLVGQCEDTTQPNGSFWCHAILQRVRAILLLILLNKFVLVLFYSYLDMW